MMLARLSVPPVFAFAVTTALFYLMQYLISSADTTLKEVIPLPPIEMVRIKKELKVELPPKIKPIPEAKLVPRRPNVTLVLGGPSFGSTKFEPPTVKLAVEQSPGWSDGVALPIFKVAPKYPDRAKQRGLLGWVVIQFDVNERGMVMDPVVIDNCATAIMMQAGLCEDVPNDIFNRAALKAVVKFKYKPKVVDEVPVYSYGVRNKIIFQLDAG